MDQAHDVNAEIISEQTLLREGMKALLVGSRYRVIREFDSIQKATDESRDDVDLIFVGAELGREILEPLKSLRAAFPRSRIALYAQAIHLPMNTLIDIFGSVLDGCLASDASPRVIRQSLDLIVLGEPVFPYTRLLFAHLDQVQNEIRSVPNLALGRNFSEREIQVLDLLRSGHSNKFIARNLQISEATVKVHIKTVLRKIGASNRTQAAIWAMQNNDLWNQRLDIDEREPEAREDLLLGTPK